MPSPPSNCGTAGATTYTAIPLEVQDQRYAVRAFLFFGAILLVTTLASALMADLLIRSGLTFWKGLLLATFVPLFGYATYGFFHAWYGFWTLRRKRDPGLLMRSLDSRKPVELDGNRTAIILPIYHEDVAEVFARLRVNFLSLQETGELEHFDFFILSDSQNPNIWSREEVAWARLCEELNAFGRIYYRRRQDNTGKKAGNVAEFCRRWGSNYDHMIVLDADSILSGRTAVKMAQLMIANPKAGLIQTVPRLCNAESLFGRIQQFSMRFYGKIFLAGLNFWQQHNGNYWGHNAIIRTSAFMENCDLPQLPGRKPFGGHILSHDFVEAALLRRAGWEVWLVPCLGESYEEGPPGLSESAARDRRWCAGNLQHSMLLFADKLKMASRLHLAGGIMSYLASPLWLLFLLICSVVAWQDSKATHTDKPESSFLPFLETVSIQSQSLILLGLTLTILFTPKFLAWADLFLDTHRRRSFAGALRTGASVFLECLFSILFAPVLMLLHTQFVIENLTGVSISWNGQTRASGGISWTAAFHQHKWHTLLGIAWGVAAWTLTPSFFWWLSPVLLGMTLSIPLAYLTSSTMCGQWFRDRGLFLTPEEVRPPKILKRLRAMPEVPVTSNNSGICDLILDPFISAFHLNLLSTNSGAAPVFGPAEEACCQSLLQEGPDRLQPEELNNLLGSDNALRWLHREVWTRPDAKLAPYWQERMRSYEDCE